MSHGRPIFWLICGVIYFVIGHVFTKRAMKHFKGSKDPIWFESPLLDPDLFTEEGKRIIRALHFYYLIGGALLMGIAALLNHIP